MLAQSGANKKAIEDIANIKGMSSIKSEGGPIGDDKWFYDKDQRKRIVDKQGKA